MRLPKVKVQHARQESALDEARQVAAWAAPTTPEWVRCVGALWEASRPFSEAAPLEKSYRALLHGMLSSDPNVSRRLDDLEVVVRQLRQRAYFVAAALATEVGTELFPNESWVFSAAANCARQAGDPRRGLSHDLRCAELLEAAGSPEAPGAWKRYTRAALLCRGLDAATLSHALRKDGLPDTTVEAIVTPRADRPLGAGTSLALEVVRLERLMPSDPDAATTEALHRFDALAASDIAEDTAGHTLVELLLAVLIQRRDRRARRVAQRLLDAKLELWGECPSAWLERQNLGGVLVELGDLAEGRALIEDARARLVAAVGEDPPHVAMCDRNLTRLAERAPAKDPANEQPANKPAKPAKPAKLVKPAKPAKPVKPVKPAKPVKPVKPAKPANKARKRLAKRAPKKKPCGS